jgi:uncharacterized SAM-binding protein YcdF (DUF218 family)
VIFVALFLQAGNFLSSPAKQPTQADCMVILGGDGGARTAQGIELYRQNYSRKIVLTGIESGEPAAQSYYLNWRAQMLIAAGIPKESIEYDPVSSSSWDEANITLKLAKKHGWKRVLVVSDPPHMLRLKWVWSKIFIGSGVDVVLVPSTPNWWNAGKWWSNEQSAKFVMSEYLKILYYLVKY